MTEHRNAIRTRQYLETFARGDLEALRDFFADDIVWHVAGSHPLSGDYHGKDELISYFQKARESTGGSLNVAPIAMFVR